MRKALFAPALAALAFTASGNAEPPQTSVRSEEMSPPDARR